jgi:hypothetical protein
MKLSLKTREGLQTWGLMFLVMLIIWLSIHSCHAVGVWATSGSPIK